MSELFSSVRQHYEKNKADVSLVSKITRILDSLSEGSFAISQLAALAQFHVMGLEATKQLAQMAGIESGMAVLDAGSGLGGPSRYLASTYGCRAIGVDLSRRGLAGPRLGASIGLAPRLLRQNLVLAKIARSFGSLALPLDEQELNPYRRLNPAPAGLGHRELPLRASTDRSGSDTLPVL